MTFFSESAILKRMKKEHGRITVVIPNYNGERYLAGCFDAVRAQSVPCDIIVVDDGSADASAERTEAYIDRYAAEMSARGTGMRLLQHTANRGFAAAVNTGVRAAKTPYVLLLNNDTKASKHLAARLLAAMEEENRALSRKQGGKGRTGETGSVFSVSAKMLSMKDPAKIDDCGDLYCALGWAFSPGRDKSARLYTKRARITSACAGAALYDRALFLALGGMDEAHVSYLEDVDLGLRAWKRGYCNLYEPTARVLHAGSATTGGRYNAFKERMTVANNLYVIRKHFPPVLLVLNAPLLLTGFLVKLLYFWKKGLGGPYLQGVSDGIKKIRAHPEAAAGRKSGKMPEPDGTVRREPGGANLQTPEPRDAVAPDGRRGLLRFEAMLLWNCVRRLAG